MVREKWKKIINFEKIFIHFETSSQIWKKIIVFEEKFIEFKKFHQILKKSSWILRKMFIELKKSS